ncbi:MAG: GatB/YqeY domain-containing protein, partial [Anaerolineales bacterium]
MIALYGAVTTSEGRWNQTRKMSLKEQLQQDLHQAIRDRDSHRKSALRLALARIANEEIAKQRELKDAETLDLIGTEIKLHRESLAEFEKAGR